jgi:uncharacterized membrane protein YdjX (TVP38/TMEM64 family)
MVNDEKSKRWTRLLLLAVFLLITALMFYFMDTSNLIPSKKSIENIISYIRGWGMFAPVIFMLLVIVEVIIAPLPGWPIYVVGGTLFGTILGGFVVLIGNIIGAMICFKLAQKLGRPFVERFFEKSALKKMNHLLESKGGIFIFLIRLNPLTSSDIFSYAAGLTKMKFSHFVFATSFALLPYAFFPSLLGEYLFEIDLRIMIFMVLLIVAYVLFGLFIFLIK